jgi:DNA repair protein RadC
MRNYIIIIVLIIVITIGILIFRKKKQDKLEGLGKAVSAGRPPKVRIVYSKKQDPKDRQKITSSNDAFMILKDIWSNQIDTRQEMVILLLDRSNMVLGYDVLSMGGITGTVADIRLLYSAALNSLATGFIMCHNHPSGNMTPSQSDIDLTRKVKEAGTIMDIQLLDHLIISNNNYYSFADEGIL